VKTGLFVVVYIEVSHVIIVCSIRRCYARLYKFW